MDSSANLTAHFARAGELVATAADISAGAEPGDDADGSRCAASVISGQRCRRLAAEGSILCVAHIAMGTKVPSAR